MKREQTIKDNDSFNDILTKNVFNSGFKNVNQKQINSQHNRGLYTKKSIKKTKKSL